MTPAFTLPWLVVAAFVVLMLVSAAFTYRRRVYFERFRAARSTFEVQGAPVTRELQQLLGAYGSGRVVGVVQLKEGLQVTYSNGASLTFVPVHTGGVPKV